MIRRDFSASLAKIPKQPGTSVAMEELLKLAVDGTQVQVSRDYLRAKEYVIFYDRKDRSRRLDGSYAKPPAPEITLAGWAAIEEYAKQVLAEEPEED